MAKTSVILRNERRKKMVTQHRELRAELKRKAISAKLSDEERHEARVKLQKLPRNGAKVRVRNRCQVTGRPRGVYGKLLISRIVFREMAHRGLLPGIKKASW